MTRAERFAKLAEETREHGSGANQKLAAAQIEGLGLQDEGIEDLTNQLKAVTAQITKSTDDLTTAAKDMTGGLGSVRTAVGEFNQNSGKLTWIVIVVAGISALANVVYCATFVLRGPH